MMSNKEKGSTRKKNPRRLWIIAVAAVIVLLLIYGLVPKATSVGTENVTRAPMSVTIEEEGLTRLVDRFVMASPVAGYAQRIDLEVGDTVKRGDRVVVIEAMPADALNPQRTAEAKARVAAAEATLRSSEQAAEAAKADATLAETELARLRGLFEADAATRRDVEVAEAQRTRAEAQRTSAIFAIDVAKHNVDAAQTAFKFAGRSSGGQEVVVSAPIDGTILAVAHQSAGVVGPGAPLFEIGDPSRLEVAVDVLSQDATQIEPGMRVFFERWGGKELLEGVVRTVEPVGFTKMSALGVEEQRVWTIVDFTSPRDVWKRLGSGYRVIAQFVIWESDDVLQIPSSSAFKSAGEWTVFQFVGGKAMKKTVAIGQQSGLRFQVTNGLTDGDEVVVHPPSTLADGSKVERR